jgi:hypothetical protein
LYSHSWNSGSGQKENSMLFSDRPAFRYKTAYCMSTLRAAVWHKSPFTSVRDHLLLFLLPGPTPPVDDTTSEAFAVASLALHHRLTSHRRRSRLHFGDWERRPRCRNMEECFSNECFVCAVCLVGCVVQLQHKVIMC